VCGGAFEQDLGGILLMNGFKLKHGSVVLGG
jgi:hypothetical protein